MGIFIDPDYFQLPGVDEVDGTMDEEEEEEPTSSGANRFDIIALNLKYMCLIQCIIEQLKTLPGR